MKRFAFRLDAVRRVRDVQEELAKAAVAAADADLRRARAVAAHHASRLGALEVATSGGAVAFLAERERVVRHAQAVTESAVAVARAQEARQASLDEWAVRHRAVEGLARIEMRAREEHRVEMQRNEDRAVDELVVARARRSAR